jgi:DNA-binding MarR family transcriptional regulator
MNADPVSAQVALTPRQSVVLNFIADQISRTGCSPTMDCIAAFLGVNRSTAHGHVKSLTARGALVDDGQSRARGMRLTAAGRAHVAGRRRAS